MERSRSLATPPAPQHGHRLLCALYNTTGSVNTATGASALFSNTTGNDNTAIGLWLRSFNNTTGGKTTRPMV